MINANQAQEFSSLHGTLLFPIKFLRHKVSRFFNASNPERFLILLQWLSASASIAIILALNCLYAIAIPAYYMLSFFEFVVAPVINLSAKLIATVMKVINYVLPQRIRFKMSGAIGFILTVMTAIAFSLSLFLPEVYCMYQVVIMKSIFLRCLMNVIVQSTFNAIRIGIIEDLMTVYINTIDSIAGMASLTRKNLSMSAKMAVFVPVFASLEILVLTIHAGLMLPMIAYNLAVIVVAPVVLRSIARTSQNQNLVDSLRVVHPLQQVFEQIRSSKGLFIVKVYSSIHNAMLNLYRSRFANNFDPAVQQFLETKNFLHVSNFFKKHDNPKSDPLMAKLGMQVESRMHFQISSSKFAAQNYWKQQNVNQEMQRSIAQQLNLVCPLSGSLPTIPVRCRGDNHTYDLFELLKLLSVETQTVRLNGLTISSCPVNPVTGRLLSIEDIYYSPLSHEKIKHAIAKAKDPNVADLPDMDRFEHLLPYAIANNNFSCVTAFLAEKAALSETPTGYTSFDFGVHQTVIDNYRQSQRLLENETDNTTLLSGIFDLAEYKESQLECSFNRTLMLVPVYLPLENNKRYYMDFFTLLDWLKRSDKHPVYNRALRLEEVYFDNEKYATIQEIRRQAPALLEQIHATTQEQESLSDIAAFNRQMLHAAAQHAKKHRKRVRASTSEQAANDGAVSAPRLDLDMS